MFSIGDNKSLGPDGFTSGFFKQDWEYVIKAVQEFFQAGVLSSQANTTNLVTIPKSNFPKTCEDFCTFHAVMSYINAFIKLCVKD